MFHFLQNPLLIHLHQGQWKVLTEVFMRLRLRRQQTEWERVSERATDREKNRGEFSLCRKYLSSCIWPLMLWDRNTALQVLPNGIDHYKNTCLSLGKQQSRHKVPWLSCGSKYCLRGANNNHSQRRFWIARRFHRAVFDAEMSWNNRVRSGFTNRPGVYGLRASPWRPMALIWVIDRLGGLTFNVESPRETSLPWSSTVLSI